MLKDIKKFFEEKLLPSITADNATSGQPDTGVDYATAALFIELAKADFNQDAAEHELMLTMLHDTFDLTDQELSELVSLAEAGSSDANDLFQFTSLVNKAYTNSQKIKLLENFWKIAYADGRLDKYEEQFIRKITGLINLPPSELMKTKHRIKTALE